MNFQRLSKLDTFFFFFLRLLSIFYIWIIIWSIFFPIFLFLNFLANSNQGVFIYLFIFFLLFFRWLLIPCVVGIIFYLFLPELNDVVLVSESQYMPFFSLFICFWSIFYIKSFERCANFYSLDVSFIFVLCN